MVRMKACTQRWGLWLSASVVLWTCGPLHAGDETTALAEKYIPRLEKILMENIAPFWYDKSLDHEHGGYIINFGPDGQPRGSGTKMIVSQARTVWLFSRLGPARPPPGQAIGGGRPRPARGGGRGKTARVSRGGWGRG